MMTGKFNILFFLFLPLLRMAKIVAEGSFKYLTDKLVIIYLFYFVRFYSSLNFFQDYTKKDVAELHYESKTKTETLSGDLARRVS